MGDFGFWTFTNTGKHATVDDAIARGGAHPAVKPLIKKYLDAWDRMIELERRSTRRSD